MKGKLVFVAFVLSMIWMVTFFVRERGCCDDSSEHYEHITLSVAKRYKSYVKPPFRKYYMDFKSAKNTYTKVSVPKIIYVENGVNDMVEAFILPGGEICFKCVD